jgi:hypothetical protein
MKLNLMKFIEYIYLDHTYGTSDGWYIYMEASYPNQYNQRCRIISEQIQDQRCIQFW